MCLDSFLQNAVHLTGSELKRRNSQLSPPENQEKIGKFRESPTFCSLTNQVWAFGSTSKFRLFQIGVRFSKVKVDPRRVPRLEARFLSNNFVNTHLVVGRGCFPFNWTDLIIFCWSISSNHQNRILGRKAKPRRAHYQASLTISSAVLDPGGKRKKKF